jgi:hypothetical protein
MQRRQRPRAVTLTLPDAKQPHLLFDGKTYTLRNFSESGIGLWMTTPAPFGLHKGNRIHGDVEIDHHIHPVDLEVVHHSPRTVGLRITRMSTELKELFTKLLEPVTYAGTLVSHARSGEVDSETGLPRLWLVGKGGSELIVWFNDLNRMISALQLCWVGKWVSRHQFRAPETGFLCDEKRYREGAVVRDDELLQKHSAAAPELMQQAAQFLAGLMPPLPGHLLWQFLETGEQVYLPADLPAKIKVA